MKPQHIYCHISAVDKIIHMARQPAATTYILGALDLSQILFPGALAC